MVRYLKQRWEMGKTLEVVEATPNPQSVTATTYTVRLCNGEGSEFQVPEAHVQNADIIVRARMECVGRRDLASLFSAAQRFAVPPWRYRSWTPG